MYSFNSSVRKWDIKYELVSTQLISFEVNRKYKSALFPLTRQQINYNGIRSVWDDTSSSIDNEIVNSWPLNKNKDIGVYRPQVS